MKMRISNGFLLLAAALFYFDRNTDLFVPGLIACTLHELGHITAIRLLGGRVKAIRLTAMGAEMELDGSAPLSYGKEALAAAAGPAASFLVAYAAAGMHQFLFAGLSMTAGLFNVLPIWPLDGGRVLLCMLYGAMESEKAERVVLLLSFGLMGALFGAGLILFLIYGNPTLSITAGLFLLGKTKRFFEKKACN